VKNNDPLLGINRLKSEIKTLKSDIQSLQSASKQTLEFSTIAGVEVAVEIVENGDIKTMIDEMKNQKESLAVMLFQKKGDKVMMAAGIKNASAKAGAWIKEVAPIVGGGGGGRDDFAQAGGKDASKLEEAKSQALTYIKATLS
jgi:alanyl-tRNA synthetase